MAEVMVTFKTRAELAEFRKFQKALREGKKDLRARRYP